MVATRADGLKALRSKMRRLSDAGPITEALRLTLSNAWRAGGETFIRAAIVKVLVDTGMSAASFFPLSRALKRAQNIGRADRAIESRISTGPGTPKPGEPTFPSGQRVPGFQDIGSGRRLGERAYTFRVPETKNSPIVFAFAFKTVVFQHAFHENMQHSLEIGVAAFRERVTLRFERDARFIISQFYGTRKPVRGSLRISPERLAAITESIARG